MGQRLSLCTEDRHGLMGLLALFLCKHPGSVHADKPRIRILAFAGVFLCRLAQLLCRSQNIEKIVGDLEGNTNRLAISCQGINPFGRSSRENASDAHRGPQKGPGLVAMKIFQLRKGQVLSLRDDIEKLPPHHSGKTGGM